MMKLETPELIAEFRRLLHIRRVEAIQRLWDTGLSANQVKKTWHILVSSKSAELEECLNTQHIVGLFDDFLDQANGE